MDRLRVACLSLLIASPAWAGMGLFSSPDGTDCNVTFPHLQAVDIYVLYLGQGGPQATGAEYKIEGMPGTFGVDYIASLFNPPGSGLNLGNGFDGTGHNVAWPSLPPFDQNGNLLCATYGIVVIEPDLVPAGTILRVSGRTPPTNDQFPCPYVTDVGFHLLCQSGGEMHVNGGPTCTVGVKASTWSEVRNLHR